MNPTIRCKLFFRIANTLKQLHKKGVIHRDLNPLHIFLDENSEPLISGFENTRYLNENMDVWSSGTPLFMAPEISSEEYECGLSIDVFSYGIILYSMFETIIQLDD